MNKQTLLGTEGIRPLWCSRCGHLVGFANKRMVTEQRIFSCANCFKVRLEKTIRLADPSTLSNSLVPPEFAGEEAKIVAKNLTGHYSIEILSKPGYLFDITKDEILTTEV